MVPLLSSTVLAPSFAARKKQGDLVSPGVLPGFSLRTGSLREARRGNHPKWHPPAQAELRPASGHSPEASEGPRVGEADQPHRNLNAAPPPTGAQPG